MQAFGRSKVKNRDLPIQSPQCETKWLSHCKDMHKRNLKSIKPAIDNKWGVKRNGVTDSKRPTYSHLSSNAARARRDDGAPRGRPNRSQHDARYPHNVLDEACLSISHRHLTRGGYAAAPSRPFGSQSSRAHRAVARGGEGEPALAEQDGAHHAIGSLR